MGLFAEGESETSPVAHKGQISLGKMSTVELSEPNWTIKKRDKTGMDNNECNWRLRLATLIPPSLLTLMNAGLPRKSDGCSRNGQF